LAFRFVGDNTNKGGAKGVEFTKTPKKEFYGTEAIFKDDSGNWFSLAQLN
jgi:hypothetical protein